MAARGCLKENLFGPFLKHFSKEDAQKAQGELKSPEGIHRPQQGPQKPHGAHDSQVNFGAHAPDKALNRIVEAWAPTRFLKILRMLMAQ